jgi:predicted nucleic acid-binding protein
VTGEIDGLAPDLVFGEAANAFRSYVRSGVLHEEDARAKLAFLVELPLKIASLRSLAVDSLGAALEHGLSVYDACYVVLAEAADAVLVTADARLAQSSTRAALLPEAHPPTGTN